MILLGEQTPSGPMQNNQPQKRRIPGGKIGFSAKMPS